MRARAVGLVGVVSIATAATAAVVASPARQAPSAPPTEFVAFRVDDERVVATVKVIDDGKPLQVDESKLSSMVASFGYRYFAAPDSWRDRLPATVRPDSRWMIDAAPGLRVDAIPEGLVGGAAGCGEAVGILMRVSPTYAKAFAALPARYFIAEPATGASPSASAPPIAAASTVATLTPPPLTGDQRRTLESMLGDLLTRELPNVRAEADDDVARMAKSDVAEHIAWATERRRLDAALDAGRARLKYDVQAFRLAPVAAAPSDIVYFVRAEWLVGSRQAFAAALWLRASRDRAFEIVQTNLRPASWLRMWEFQGELEREQLGLVLNVLDRDGDGWGEVLSSLTGYEGMSITLRTYTPTGFQSTGVVFSQGC